MAKRRRRKKKYEEEEEQEGFELNPETKRGIIIVSLFAVSALMILSFFGIAGSLGEVIENSLSAAFGWDRVLIAVLLLVIGATRIFPDRGQFSLFNYIGMVLFFLSFNGMLNLLLVHTMDPVTTDLTMAGGYLGEILSLSLPQVIGFWGTFVVIASLLVVSILLVFNTSLRNILGAHQHFTGWFGVLAHWRRSRGEEDDTDWEEDEEADDSEDEEEEEETEEEEEVEQEEEEEEEEEEVEQEEVVRGPVMVGAPAEGVLTVKRRRKISIPVDLLDYRSSTAKGKQSDIDKNKKIIEETFKQFGIDVEMSKTAVGPTVTQYTLRPSQGVKLSRVIGLQNDLALALAAHPIRIEAPIPGKSLVGIEIPNKSASMVSLRELIESKEFKKRTSNLTTPLGKDVAGIPWAIAVDKMPHMLVAGATGSGKSVCLNTMIVSMLYANGPDDLKLILVDPKRVEMKLYEGIPHLLVPPITKADDTLNALKWTVREMERRLDVLAKFGARDINSYNTKAKDKMPKIVVIIDELADLMATASRDVEGLISRIAQMARAVGIHLILATQRPSVDVITGVIKANIPARIAFAVASQTDSRTILDCAGAEKLLGRGDMLFDFAETSKPKRIQGAFVSEGEVERIVAHLKREGTPDYNYAITEQEKTGTILDNAEDSDPLIEDAINAILEGGKASTSFLQRRLKVGYARAARMMDILEEMGVISEGQGAKPRDILIDEWPPGGSIAESIPTAEDDYDEAGEYEEEDEPEYEEEDEEEPEDDSDDIEEEEEGDDEEWEEGDDDAEEEEEEEAGDEVEEEEDEEEK